MTVQTGLFDEASADANLDRPARKREYDQKRAAERVAKGLCSYCGLRPPAIDKRLRHLKRCADCRDRKQPTQSKKYVERIKGGLCGRCGQRERRLGLTTCADCQLKRANRRLRERVPVKLLKSLVTGARCRAVKRGMAFELDYNDLLPLPEKCPVLGLEFDYSAGSRQNRDRSISLDRTNPSLGYVRGNVRVISWRANQIKTNASAAELEAVAAYVRGIEASVIPPSLSS